jgi:hypothetical protein
VSGSWVVVAVVVIAAEQPWRFRGRVGGALVAELGGGGPSCCLRCAFCSGRVASFVRRCRSTVLGVRFVSFVFASNFLLS